MERETLMQSFWNWFHNSEKMQALLFLCLLAIAVLSTLLRPRKKTGPGAHSTGKAIDIAVSGERALKVIELALAAGIKRIGVNQKGAHRFIHLDVCDDKTSPTIWSY